MKDDDNEDSIIMTKIRNCLLFILLVTLALEDISSEAEQHESVSPLESGYLAYAVDP